MARQLTLVPAPGRSEDAVLTTVEPALRACLAGAAPLAVVPAGSETAVDAAREVLRPELPLEDGADLVVLTSGSTGSGRGVLLSADALTASATATVERLGGPGTWLLALPVSYPSMLFGAGNPFQAWFVVAELLLLAALLTFPPRPGAATVAPAADGQAGNGTAPQLVAA